MGIIKRGILGGFSNKVANVVGSSWKGIAYMRAMPLSVANPRTAGQVNQRTRFGTISAFASAIVGSWVQPLWNRFAVQASGFNDFVRVNIDYVANNGTIDYTNLKMSKGKLLNIVNQDYPVTPVAGDFTIQTTWDDNTGDSNALANDEIYVIGYNFNKDLWSGVGVNQRSVGAVNITFNEEVSAGNQIWVYFSARRQDGTIVSDSKYLSITV